MLSCYSVRGTCLALLETYLNSVKNVVVLITHAQHFNISGMVSHRGTSLDLFCSTYTWTTVNISGIANYIIYADDTYLFISAPDVNALMAAGNATPVKLRLRSEINELKITSTKSKAVVFRPKNKCVIRNDILKIGSTEIDIVGRQKTLGVVFFRIYPMERSYSLFM